MDVSPTPLASATPEHRRHRKKKVKRSSRIKRKAPLVIALLLAWVALLGVWYYLVTIWHPAAQATP